LRVPESTESLRIAGNRQSPDKLEPQAGRLRRQLAQLRRQAQGVMGAIQQGRLQGRALEEALGTYQRIWAQVEQLEQEQPATSASAPAEIHYDRAVVEDFVARLPEALRADVRLGREFLREPLRHVPIADVRHPPRTCPY